MTFRASSQSDGAICCVTNEKTGTGILLAFPLGDCMATLPSPAPHPSAVPGASLAAIVSAGAPSTIAEVIAQMEAIDNLLSDNDGLKWFNRLYLMVTQQVDQNPPGGAWRDPEWLTRLDVVFAGLYFSAIRSYLAGAPTPAAWVVLFEARFSPQIERIQFALAGMNAHINHDLAIALGQTNTDLNRDPEFGGPEHIDYLAVNTLLDAVMPAALDMLSAGLLGEAAEDSGKVGRLLGSFNIYAARDAAWDFACLLRDLGGLAREAALDAQDRSTFILGRTLLTAV